MKKYLALINMGTVLDEWKEVYLVSEVDATIKEKDAELFVVRQSLFAEAITVGGLKQSLNEAREQIAALQMYKDATLGKESERERQIVALKVELDISHALEANFFPQRDAYDVVIELTKAGFGKRELNHGNTLLGMTKNCLEANVALTADNSVLREQNSAMKRIALKMLNSAAGAKKHTDELYAVSETIDQWIKELEK